jgi:hypothetical protein
MGDHGYGQVRVRGAWRENHILRIPSRVDLWEGIFVLDVARFTCTLRFDPSTVLWNTTFVRVIFFCNATLR